MVGEWDVPRFVGREVGMMTGLILGHLLELEIATGELIFEWNALEHVDPSGKIILPYNSTSKSNPATRKPSDIRFHKCQ